MDKVIQMLFIFSMLNQFRHLWQLKVAILMHRYLMRVDLKAFSYTLILTTAKKVLKHRPKKGKYNYSYYPFNQGQGYKTFFGIIFTLGKMTLANFSSLV